MAIVRIHLNLSYHEFMKFYQGAASAVRARAPDGRLIQFPARNIQPYLTHQGIQGEFEIEFSDDTHKLIAVRRCTP